MKIVFWSALICLIFAFTGSVSAYDPVQDPRLVRKKQTTGEVVKSNSRRKFYDMQTQENNRSARQSGDSELRHYSLTRGKRAE